MLHAKFIIMDTARTAVIARSAIVSINGAKTTAQNVKI